MQSKLTIVLFTGVLSIGGAKIAAADTPEKIGDGISISAGGGVAGFTNTTMRDTTQVGGIWNLRATYGTDTYVAVEGGYTGSAQTIDAQLGTASSTLLGTTLEGDLRGNLLKGDWQPYAFVGAGWTRYDVSASFTTADNGINSTDNLFVVPMGAGLSYHYDNLIADLRGTFRYATNQDLVLTNPKAPTSTDFAPMHTWGASATVGFGF